MEAAKDMICISKHINEHAHVTSFFDWFWLSFLLLARSPDVLTNEDLSRFSKPAYSHYYRHHTSSRLWLDVPDL